MMQARLHLVDTAGVHVRASIQAAVEDAFRWTLRSFPLIDTALMSNWAEEVARSMEAASGDIKNPRRYAAAALQGKVKDWQKTGAARLEPVGIGSDLERLSGADSKIQTALDRALLLEQAKISLNERDRLILALLLDGCNDAEIAAALKISPVAGRKAIERMKDRISTTLRGSRSANPSGNGSGALCMKKG